VKSSYFDDSAKLLGRVTIATVEEAAELYVADMIVEVEEAKTIGSKVATAR
jgi:hypothetical protein